MTPTAERLYQLLPAVYRLRDADEGEPLKALVEVIAEQVAVLEDDLAQLYDDQFIETCAPWVAPYLGDLIGYRPLHGVVLRVSSPRAEIAHTIGYRRRKGTVAVLEQVARDVSGWPACVVEFFQRLATTQYMNHIRLGNRSPDLREWEPLARLDSPFDQLAHTVDVRRIPPTRGRYNLSNVGVFLWRLQSQPLTNVQPAKLDERRYWFNPLGLDTPLFTRPEPKRNSGDRSTRMNVPEPIGRRMFAAYTADYFGSGKSIVVTVDGVDVAAEQIVACELSDTPSGAWAQAPAQRIGIDPVLGRMVFPRDQPPPRDVRVSYHFGFSADSGGGEYDRSASVPPEFSAPALWQAGVTNDPGVTGENVYPTIEEALLAWNEQPPGVVGVITVMNSGTYRGDLEIRIPEESRLLVVAAEWPELVEPDRPKRRVPGRFNAVGCRPHLAGNVSVRGLGDRGGKLCLNGLLIEGALSVAQGWVAEISLDHCTLVPGLGFSPEGYPLAPRAPSVSVEVDETILRLRHCLTGGLRITREARASVADSIIDATSRCGVAYAAPDGFGPGGTLELAATTIVGKVHTGLLELATNTIFFSRLARHDDWLAPVISARRQQGCVRFSFVPWGSRTPPRYECQPRTEEDAARVVPPFTSLAFGDPGYAQLSAVAVPEIFHGADDESEMGAFHELFEPQRITNVGVRLEEYLRFGLEAGIFFEPRVPSRKIVPNAYTYHQWVDLCGDSGSEALPGIGAGLI